MAGPFARTHVKTVARWSVREGTVSAQTRPVVMRGLEPHLPRILTRRKGGWGSGLIMDFFFAIHDVLLYTLNETVVVVYDPSP